MKIQNKKKVQYFFFVASFCLYRAAEKNNKYRTGNIQNNVDRRLNRHQRNQPVFINIVQIGQKKIFLNTRSKQPLNPPSKCFNFFPLVCLLLLKKLLMNVNFSLRRNLIISQICVHDLPFICQFKCFLNNNQILLKS